MAMEPNHLAIVVTYARTTSTIVMIFDSRFKVNK